MWFLNSLKGKMCNDFNQILGELSMHNYSIMHDCSPLHIYIFDTDGNDMHTPSLH